MRARHAGPQLRAELGREIGGGRHRQVRDERALVRVAHLDREVAHVRGALGQQLEQAQVRRVVALHRADLQDAAGRVARGRDAVALLDRERERLLAEHVQPRLERAACDVGVKRVGHADDDRVEAEAEQVVESGVPLRDAVAIAHRRAHGGGRVGERSQLEALALIPEEVRVRRLAHEPRADQPDAQARPVVTHESSLERCNPPPTISRRGVFVGRSERRRPRGVPGRSLRRSPADERSSRSRPLPPWRLPPMTGLALVGAGRMGATHLRALQRARRVQLQAICDPSPAAAALGAAGRGARRHRFRRRRSSATTSTPC